MITLLIYLLIFCAICYLVWWAMNSMAVPQPVRVVAVVIMAIIGIVFLLQFLPAGGSLGHLGLR